MDPVVVVMLSVAVVAFAVMTAMLVVLLRRIGGAVPKGLTPEQEAEVSAQLEEARREAAGIRAKAQDDAGELLRRSEAAVEAAAEMRKEVEAEGKVLKYELKELRADLERRENRLAEREQRLDDEARRQADQARKTRRDGDRAGRSP